jgi:hypothetical protein
MWTGPDPASFWRSAKLTASRAQRERRSAMTLAGAASTSSTRAASETELAGPTVLSLESHLAPSALQHGQRPVTPCLGLHGFRPVFVFSCRELRSTVSIRAPAQVLARSLWRVHRPLPPPTITYNARRFQSRGGRPPTAAGRPEPWPGGSKSESATPDLASDARRNGLETLEPSSRSQQGADPGTRRFACLRRPKTSWSRT